jgi:hypothetical protein
MYHIPNRSKHLNVNPWPVAIQRILIFLAILFMVAFLRPFLEWMFDHLDGQSRFSFNTASLLYLLPVAGIVAYLAFRPHGVETLDSGMGQLRLFAFNAFLGTLAVYFVVWDQQGFTPMFVERAPEAYPYPYHGTITLLTTWAGIVLTLQMIGTVIIALKDAKTNVYETDVEY